LINKAIKSGSGKADPTVHAAPESPAARAGTQPGEARHAIIGLSGLRKSFGKQNETVAALDDVSLAVRPGEILGIIGRSGAGKSTLLRCINGLERPDTGAVLIDGEDVTRYGASQLLALRRTIGMIFQHFNLLSSRTVFGNVALPLELAGVPRARIEERVARLLDLVGLADKRDAYPAKLSGGQKQRVGIARALATEPRILLCDEATSALDPETTRQILALLADINAKLGLTIVLITHEMSVVRDLCDRMVVLERGRIVEEGPVAEIFAAPVSAVTRSLLQEVMPDLPSALAERIEAEPRPGAQALVRLRFSGEGAGEPVIAELARRLDVAASVLHGTVEYIKRTPVGVLVIALPADLPRPLDEIVGFLGERAQSAELVGYVAPTH